MNPSTLVLYTGAENATVIIRIANLDWTGALAEIEIVPRPGEEAILLTSAEGGALALSPDASTDILLTYGPELVGLLHIGDSGRWSGFRTVGAVRNRIEGGVVLVGGPGQFFGAPRGVTAGPVVQGPSGTLVVESVVTLAPGDDAYIEQLGTPSAAIWRVGLPQGATGLTPDISVLSTTTLAPGEPAAVSLDPTSTPEAPKLVFGIPKGDKGDTGDVTPELEALVSAATTQAGNAEAAAAAAAADVIAADAAKALAEAARDASFANAKGDTTVALARARVADGETFVVFAPGGDTYDAYRRESSSTETFLGSYPSAARTVALETKTADVIAAAPAGYGWAVVDAFGMASVGVSLDGDFRASTINGKPVAEWQLETSLSGALVAYAPPGYAYAWLDDLDNAPVGIKSDGTLAAVRMEATYLNGVAVAGIIAGGGGGGAAVYRRRYGAEIEMVLSYGQSLSVGADAIPPITTTQRFDNLKFAGGVRSADSGTPYTSLVPLTETTASALGETPVAGATDIIKERVLAEDGLAYTDHTYQLLGSAPGAGGAAISALVSGTAPFIRFVADVQAGYDLAQAAGKSFKAGAFFWTQGESDYIQNTPKATYKAAIVQLRNDLEDAVQSITAQTEPLVCISYQTQAHVAYGYTGNPYIAVAQLEVSKESPHHYVACPLYWSPSTIHQTAINSKRLGAYYGLCYKRVVIDGEDWMPLMPVQVDRQGKIITARFHVPRGELVLDTTLLTLKTAYGFSVATSGGLAVTIDSVSVIGPDTVKIVTATDAGASSRLRYGFGANGGNLRDSQGDTVIFDGGGLNYPMHNWCVIFDELMA